MATANIELPNGTKVLIEGSPEEIARVLELYRQPSRAMIVAPKPEETKQRRRGGAPDARPDSSSRGRTGIMQQLRFLISEQFFDARQTLSNVQSKLEELGHIYPQNQISTPLRRLVVGRELRRLREGKNWVYVIAR
jgi:hypothetical protein